MKKKKKNKAGFGLVGFLSDAEKRKKTRLEWRRQPGW
jgi:hypothetical protein